MKQASGAGKGGHGGQPPPNDFLNRLLDSSKLDEKEPCAGMGGGAEIFK